MTTTTATTRIFQMLLRKSRVPDPFQRFSFPRCTQSRSLLAIWLDQPSGRTITLHNRASSRSHSLEEGSKLRDGLARLDSTRLKPSCRLFCEHGTACQISALRCAWTMTAPVRITVHAARSMMICIVGFWIECSSSLSIPACNVSQRAMRFFSDFVSSCYAF